MVKSFNPHGTEAPAAPVGPGVEWEEADCLLCGGRNWSPLLEGQDHAPGGGGLWFAVVQCQDCGLCFTNPRPSAATIGQFYPATYDPHRIRRVHPSIPWWRRWWRRDRRTIPLHGQGRLLDFGCGGGSFLERMHRRGWQVLGLDISAAVVEQVRSGLGLPVLAGTLPHPELRPGSFDLITMWHALEHVHAPLEVLREAHRLLAPGGKLLVAVPNIDSLPFRWFGSAWFGLDLPRHLTHFAPWTLYLMLHRAGFRVGPVRMVRSSGWLRRSARLAFQSGPTVRWHRWLRSRHLARLAAWLGYFSHQSDSMMVMAER